MCPTLGEEVGQLGGRGGRHGGAPVAALAVGRHGDGGFLKLKAILRDFK